MVVVELEVEDGECDDGADSPDGEEPGEGDTE